MIEKLEKNDNRILPNGVGALPWALDDGEHRKIETPGATAYGYCLTPTWLLCNSGRWFLKAGMYFCTPTPFRLTGGCGLVITRYGYGGVFGLGGPIEQVGRLRYIDGCTDSLIIPPPRRGDPCLNHLHFPAGIQQTMHTHPSVRLGIVARGSGVCVTPTGSVKLTPGLSWHLPAESAHCFHTEAGPMDVIAWHPETDAGPVDDDHPMINRTIVNSMSAKHLPGIKTGKDVAVSG